MNPTTLLSGLGAAITADPGLGGANSNGRGAKPGTGDLFLSLVSGMLGDAATGTSPAADGTVVLPTAGLTDATSGTTSGATTPDAAVPGAEAATATSTATTIVATALPATGLPALLADAVAAAPTGPIATGAADPTDPTASDSHEESDDAVAAPTVGAFALAALAPLAVQALQSFAFPRPQAATGTVSPDAEVGVGAPTAVAGTATAPALTVVTAGPATDGSTGQAADQSTGGSSAQPTAPTTATATDQQTQAAAALSTSGTHAARPETRDQGADAVSATVTPIPTTGPAAPTAPAAVPTSGQPAPASRVAEQVFPEVLRIASSGTETGPRRVTVKLNPEALGEVRVILTQRRGGLEVSLSAGSDAQRALAEGAPELRRLLEAVGRVDSRIVIRDLPGASSTGSTSSTTTPSASPDGTALRSDVSTDLGGNAWSGAGRHDGEPAADRESTRYRTPGSTNATDGTPRATSPSRPNPTGTSGHSGLDVTI